MGPNERCAAHGRRRRRRRPSCFSTKNKAGLAWPGRAGGTGGVGWGPGGYDMSKECTGSSREPRVRVYYGFDRLIVHVSFDRLVENR
ncbi:hypothetical protein NL676_032607 [Syzygium grande]|nr:hypothetical protein NL676_032607 [Syzygium grande]